jgi:hypothetical protein
MTSKNLAGVSKPYTFGGLLFRPLYRTARKHVGIQGGSWEFLITTLYEKSGSEREFKKFKSDLKSAVIDDDIPGYNLDWIERENKIFVSFKNIKCIDALSIVI